MSKQPTKIVEAVAVSSVPSSAFGGTPDPNRIRLSKIIEAAMSQAVLDCISEGVTEPEDQKKRMMDARAKVIETYRIAEAKAIKEMEEAKALLGNEPQ